MILCHELLSTSSTPEKHPGLHDHYLDVKTRNAKYVGYCLSSPYDVFTSKNKNVTEIQEILQQLG